MEFFDYLFHFFVFVEKCYENSSYSSRQSILVVKMQCVGVFFLKKEHLVDFQSDNGAICKAIQEEFDKIKPRQRSQMFKEVDLMASRKQAVKTKEEKLGRTLIGSVFADSALEKLKENRKRMTESTLTERKKKVQDPIVKYALLETWKTEFGLDTVLEEKFKRSEICLFGSLQSSYSNRKKS